MQTTFPEAHVLVRASTLYYLGSTLTHLKNSKTLHYHFGGGNKARWLIKRATTTTRTEKERKETRFFYFSKFFFLHTRTHTEKEFLVSSEMTQLLLLSYELLHIQTQFKGRPRPSDTATFFSGVFFLFAMFELCTASDS